MGVGLPGGYGLKVYRVMTKYLDDITHVLARHEQDATMNEMILDSVVV